MHLVGLHFNDCSHALLIQILCFVLCSGFWLTKEERLKVINYNTEMLM